MSKKSTTGGTTSGTPKTPHPKTTPGKKKQPPRRRDGGAPLGGSQAEQEGVPLLGVPVAECLNGPVSDIEQSIDELTAVAKQMTLPSSDTGAQTGNLAGLFAGQPELSYLVARAVDRVRRAQLPLKTEVTPGALLLGQHKSYLVYEAKRDAIQGQNLAADGRLFEGARFSFYFKIVQGVYGRRLREGTPEQKARAASAMANVDKILFRILKQSQQSSADTQAQKEAIKQTMEEQKDEAAFQESLTLLEQGRMPDTDTLQRAERHAHKLQEQHGLSLDPRATTR